MLGVRFLHLEVYKRWPFLTSSMGLISKPIKIHGSEDSYWHWILDQPLRG